MDSLAILVGNTEYQNLKRLDCCRADLNVMKELVEATGKFIRTEVLLNYESSHLKDSLRSIVDASEAVEEIFFYFTGHGYQLETEFFFCATDFEARRPFETGLSNTDLHSLLRSAETELIVKVIDACSSGTLLLKSDGAFLSNDQKGFKNLIQISSCLDSQSSLTGNPLSLFTEKFRVAALRKTEGVVYYADLIATLRDEFLSNNNQTPHFVSQGTGREQFVENARRLDDIREKICNQNSASSTPNLEIVAADEERSMLTILEQIQGRFVTKNVAEAFIDGFF